MNNNHSPQQQLITINQLAQQKKITQALSLVEQLTSQHPDFSHAWVTSAFLYFQSNQSEKAIESLRMARQQEPSNMNFAFHEMMMREKMNHPEVSLKIAQDIANETLANDDMYAQLANILNKHEDFTKALPLYEKLAVRNPHQPGWLLKQAMVLLNLGQIKESKIKSNEALIAQPNNPDVLFFRSHLEKQTVDNNHISELNKILQSNYQNQAGQAKVFFALAKEYEDTKQFEDSFKARIDGANLFRKSFQYDIQSDINFMKQVRIEYNTDFVSQKSPGFLTKEPIFIVGLPRSGTTLLDRVISSHSEVKAAGELKQFNHCTLHNLQQLKIDPQTNRTDMVTCSTQINFKQLGSDYLRTSRTRTGNSPRFTDKFPQNSYYVGMILKALPQSKVIIIQRHPVAVCYAVFKQMFNHDSYPYSYNLTEMANYFIEHQKLLDHWQKIGGQSVTTVYYEDLVTDLEAQARSLFDFLELEWQANCLDFHKNSQPTATASASQVRQKLYTGSIDMWKNYEKQLQPLIEKLEQAGCLSNPKFK